VSTWDEAAAEARGYDEDGPALSDRERMRRDRDRGHGIERGFDALEKAAQHLGEQVDRAREHLGPILTPERPSPALGEVRTEPDDASPAADRLASLAYRVGSQADALRRVLDRIDL
jgi:hypothetical protein